MISVYSSWTTYPFTAANTEDGTCGVHHTWFGERDQVCDILHENAALELEFRLPPFVDKLLVGEFVLWLGEVNILATEQNRFEEVDVVLQPLSQHWDMRALFGEQVASPRLNHAISGNHR
jgi:hypothetical protein